MFLLTVQLYAITVADNQLDENGFISSRNTLKKDTDIYVMSEAAFKIFELKR